METETIIYKDNLQIPAWMCGVVANEVLDVVYSNRVLNETPIETLVTIEEVIEAKGLDYDQVKKFVGRILGNAKGRSKNPQKSRGIHAYNLDEEWVYTTLFMQDFKCPYSGVPYHFGVGKSWHGRAGDPRRPSVNRLNCTQGYTKDNCEITSNWYNNQLMAWTHKEVAPFVPGFNDYLMRNGKVKQPSVMARVAGWFGM